jgi:hypothetical protein
MPLVGFKPEFSAGKRPQTHTLDRAATGIGLYNLYLKQITFLGYILLQLFGIYNLCYM